MSWEISGHIRRLEKRFLTIISPLLKIADVCACSVQAANNTSIYRIISSQDAVTRILTCTSTYEYVLVCAQKQRSMAQSSGAGAGARPATAPVVKERDYSELVELLARYQSRRLDEQRASMPLSQAQAQAGASATASQAPEQHLISAHQRQRMTRLEAEADAHRARFF